MKTVWKFELELKDGIQEVIIPQYSQIVAVGNQYNEVVFWAEVQTNNKKVVRRFIVHGTGHPITYPTETYIGTVSTMINNNYLVWHIYEVT
jgi:hypothetical protein